MPRLRGRQQSTNDSPVVLPTDELVAARLRQRATGRRRPWFLLKNYYCCFPLSLGTAFIAANGLLFRVFSMKGMNYRGQLPQETLWWIHLVDVSHFLLALMLIYGFEKRHLILRWVRITSMIVMVDVVVTIILFGMLYADRMLLYKNLAQLGFEIYDLLVIRSYALTDLPPARS